MAKQFLLLDLIVAELGFVFTGPTTWDAQRLKLMASTVPESQSGSNAVVGALALYLIFINLVLTFLRLLGGRRD